jgi:peptidoglycan/xylan/chitin deacetylase (PgdA/CDA1 family)
MSNGIVYLMYHEIRLPDRRLVDEGPGYARYVVTEPAFRAQLQWLRTQKISGVNVTEALAPDDSRSRVAITFDDGCETDLLTAAPLLQAANFNATFYITTGFTDRPGYLSKKQLRELSDAGFDIGCHSQTHSFLPDLPPEDMRREIAEAKDELEQITGRRVANFSCPGGRWNQSVAQTARAAGYDSVVTSRIGVNAPGVDPFRLARVAVMETTTLAAFEKICRAEGFWQRQLQDAVLGSAKKMLGNSAYLKFRAVVLHDRAE